MKLFKCPACAQLLHFENTSCVNCGRRLGYVPDANVLTALDPGDVQGAWISRAEAGGRFRFCANAEHDVCNWLVAHDAPDRFCLACRHNRTIPPVSEARNLNAWRRIEAAKHRLFYTLLRLGLPTPARGDGAEPLVFDFLADAQTPDGPRAMTGHDDGLITIALAEADDVERERRRTLMGEPYRTLLGHFRHEIGHFYWDLLVRDAGLLDECRAVFGDDRADYRQSIKRHYAEGTPPNWQERYISGYATMHPWEDFAETWAHYLHIVDTLEMASAFGMSVSPRIERSGDLAAKAEIDVYGDLTIAQIVEVWVPLAFALNSINRCMGQTDLYPFILSPAVVAKLGFIHKVVGVSRSTARGR